MSRWQSPSTPGMLWSANALEKPPLAVPVQYMPSPAKERVIAALVRSSLRLANSL